jgi:hypothetical protein
MPQGLINPVLVVPVSGRGAFRTRQGGDLTFEVHSSSMGQRESRLRVAAEDGIPERF